MDLLGFKSKEDYIEYFDSSFPKLQPDGSSSQHLAYELLMKAAQTGYYSFEWTHLNRKGEIIPCEKIIICMDHDDSRRFIVYFRDLREEKKLQEHLRESQHLVRLMLDSTPLGCNLRDASLSMMDCNLEALRLFKVASREEYIQNYQLLSPVIQPDGSPSAEKSAYYFKLAKELGTITFEWMHQDTQGEDIPCEITIIRMKWYEDTIYISYIHDLRELRRTVSMLHALETKVYIDSLTEVYNRRFLMESGSQILDEARDAGLDFSCIIIDIDFFKKINDTYGHSIGDEVLKNLAKRIQAKLTDSCYLVRFGGEEFIILAPGFNREQARLLAEDIRIMIMNSPFLIQQLQIEITISQGVCSLSTGTKTLNSLIAKADHALYAAKTGGRNQVVVENSV